jgi:hypothetical protein
MPIFKPASDKELADRKAAETKSQPPKPTKVEKPKKG